MDTIVETSREYYKSSTSSSGGDTLHPGQEQVRLVNFDMLSLVCRVSKLIKFKLKLYIL